MLSKQEMVSFESVKKNKKKQHKGSSESINPLDHAMNDISNEFGKVAAPCAVVCQDGRDISEQSGSREKKKRKRLTSEIGFNNELPSQPFSALSEVCDVLISDKSHRTRKRKMDESLCQSNDIQSQGPSVHADGLIVGGEITCEKRKDSRKKKTKDRVDSDEIDTVYVDERFAATEINSDVIPSVSDVTPEVIVGETPEDLEVRVADDEHIDSDDINDCQVVVSINYMLCFSVIVGYTKEFC